MKKTGKLAAKYYAVARKGYFRVIAVYGSKEQALRQVKGKDYLEVREVIA